MRIKLTENIPQSDGRQFPYLGVVQIVATLPISPSTKDRKGLLKACLQPYMVVQIDDDEIRIPHPTEQKSLSVPNFALDAQGLLSLGLSQEEVEQVGQALFTLGSAIARKSSQEWASAEVENG